MLNHLIIKEIREKKNIIIFGLLLCVVSVLSKSIMTVFRLAEPGTINTIMPVIDTISGLILLFIYPIILSAVTISGEIERETINCLLSIPISRTKIWFYKLYSIILIQYTFMILFFAMNSHWKKIFFKDYFPSQFLCNSNSESLFWLALLIIIPLLPISASLFISNLAVIESESIALSLLFTGSIWGLFILMLKALSWDMGSFHTTVTILMISLSLLHGSLSVFREGELFTNPLKNLRMGIRRMIVPLLVMCLFIYGFYYSYNNYLFENPTSIKSTAMAKNGRDMIVALNYYGRFEECLGILSLKSGSIKKIPLRYADSFNSKLSPDKNMIIIKRYVAMDGKIWSKVRTIDSMYWLYDIDSGKLSEISDINEDKAVLSVFWLDNDRYAIWRCTPSSGTILNIHDIKNNTLSKNILPHIPGYEPDYIQANQKDNKYIHALYRTYKSEKTKNYKILRINIENNKYEILTDIKPEKNILFYGISPYEPYLTYMKFSGKKDRYLYVYDFENKKHILRLHLNASYHQGFKWLDKNLCILSTSIEGKNVVEICNLKDGEETVLTKCDGFGPSLNSFQYNKHTGIIIFDVITTKNGKKIPSLEFYDTKIGRSLKSIDPLNLLKKLSSDDSFSSFQPGIWMDDHTIILNCINSIYSLDINTEEVKKIYSLEKQPAK